ncbi:MAG: hypothetical protein V4673_13835 [Pseudomonadota bacterium]
MSNDRIVIREPRLDLGTNREVPTSLTGEQAYDWLAHKPAVAAAQADPVQQQEPNRIAVGAR